MFDHITLHKKLHVIMLPESMGSVHWSISSLTRNKNVSKALLDGPYLKDALVPSSPWLSDKALNTPLVQTAVQNDQVHISWTQPDEKNVFRWVVYYQYGTTWTYKILNRNDRSVDLPRYSQEKTGQMILNKVIVSAVDRTGKEGDKSEQILIK